MKLLYFALLFLLVSFKYINPETESTPSKLVFKQYKALTKSGIQELSELRDSIVDKEFAGEDTGSKFTRGVYKSADLESYPIDTTSLKVHIQVSNDSIWRYTTKNDSKPEKYVLIDDANGKLIYFDHLKENIIKKVDLIKEADSDYMMTIDKNDTKTIHGFDCFKMKLIHKTRNPIYGNTIYDFYVTDQIDLPFYSVVKISKKISKLFPLEIRIKPEKQANQLELVYELIELR
ncbi:hypothetical protein [Marinirhabdus gelatinilytica]|uniref:Uncharacterized protein n=1 Tax=Marinirhabdus gelatinilytica TaxID=1703343 RepID=A0A370QJ39_9FLAO|nr:hypothetical protein [Marinirhabdus gelatinilytica]RDK88378.1 hypothetical protein C8D94_101249 [Marinirhabdus gelatinilytica]